MEITALEAIHALQKRQSELVLALVAAQQAGDVARQIEILLNAASDAEAVLTALDSESQANRASQFLSMAATHLFNQGEAEEGEAVEARGAALATRWCSLDRALEFRLDQAIRRRERGQFAVVLATLVEVREAAAAGGLVQIARKAILARAETLEWLGDPARALEELDRDLRPQAPDQMPDLQYALDAVAAGDLGRLQKLEKAAMAQEVHTTWHFLRFLCLRDLSERDPARLAGAAAALAVAAVFLRADRLDCLVEFYEAQLVLLGGEAKRALALLEPLVARFRADQRLQHKQGAVLGYQARALLALGRFAEARSVARAALREDANLWHAWLIVAQASHKTADTTERRAALSAGVAAVECMRLAPLGWRLDNLYLEPRMPVYRAAINQAVVDRDGPTALSRIEAVKSRGLTAVIGAGRGVAPDADATLVREHAALDDAIARLHAGILSGTAPSDSAPALQSKRRERAELSERLRHADPRWRALSMPDPTPPAAIAETVRTLGAVALDLYIDGATLTAVIVAEGDIHVARQDVPDATMRALDRYLRGLSPPPFADGTSREPVPFEKDPAPLGLSLAALLPHDIAARVTAAERVLIAAHGPLHLLPWPVVPVAPGGPRLIARSEVGLLPNLGCLPAMAARNVGTGWCAALGAPERSFGPAKIRRLRAPACGTAMEIGALHAARDRLVAPVVSGSGATVAAFAALCAQPRAAGGILHITSHGVPSRSEPGDAALLLADADLEAAAIAHAGIPFAEVVLVACSTGFRPATEAQGIRLSGDDALGLPGAFLEAGASALLVSIPLAQVNAAHGMALGYHAARLADRTPLAAFRQAQLALLADPAIRTCHACGFVLYGCQ